MIQMLLGVNFGDICPFLFRDTGYFSKYLMGYGIAGTPYRVSLVKTVYVSTTLFSMYTVKKCNMTPNLVAAELYHCTGLGVFISTTLKIILCSIVLILRTTSTIIG